MRALVTGGAGFIGSNIVASLAELGTQVVVLDDLSTGLADNLASVAVSRLIVGDVTDLELVQDAAVGCDVVYHLAASVGNQRSISDPIRDATVNVIGTLSVMTAAVRSGVPRVVVSSSAAVYGETVSVPVHETHPLAPISPYGASKLGAEKAAIAFGKVNPVEVVCLRYFNVYGDRQRYDAYGNVIPIFVRRALAGLPLVVYGDGLQTRDYVHVSDVVAANLLAARHGRPGTAYNIGSGRGVSVLKLIDTLSMVLRSELHVVHGEPRMGDVRHSVAAIDLAESDLTYRPQRDLVTGLRSYIAWYRSAYGDRLD